jgi:hypothetical protein
MPVGIVVRDQDVGARCVLPAPANATFAHVVPLANPFGFDQRASPLERNRLTNVVEHTLQRRGEPGRSPAEPPPEIDRANLRIKEMR